MRGLVLTPDQPVETAAGVLAATPLVLVDVTTSDGVVGSAYLRCYAIEALGPMVDLTANLGESLLGGPADPVAGDEILARRMLLLGRRGLVGFAMAGIDMALWDAHARTLDAPLATVLGGADRPVPAYAGLRTMAPTTAAAEAERALAAGFTAVKLKLGRGDLAADLDAIRSVRRAIGDENALMVDYNQSLDVSEALARLAVLDDEGLAWVEEPTRAEDLTGHARIVAATRTPIQLGENWLGPDDLAAALAAEASDLVMFDAMKMGGVTGWTRAAALATAAGRRVSSHTFIEVSAHLLAVTPTAHWLEYVDHVSPILVRPVVVRDGHVSPPPGPGTGLAWAEDRVAPLVRYERLVAEGAPLHRGAPPGS